MKLRRKLILPIVLVALAGGIGGFLGAASETIEEDVSASGTRQTHFYFLPPTGPDSGSSDITCGWHSNCSRADGGTRPHTGIDFSVPVDTPLYLRGYAYDNQAQQHSGTGESTPIVVTTRDKPGGAYWKFYNDGTQRMEETRTDCPTVEAVFTGIGNTGEWAHRGTFRVLHSEQWSDVASSYYPRFSDSQPWGKYFAGQRFGTVVDDTACPSTGPHAHVEHNYDQKEPGPTGEWKINPHWTRNSAYPDHDETITKISWDNDDASSWLFKLRIFPRGEDDGSVTPPSVAPAGMPHDLKLPDIGSRTVVVKWKPPFGAMDMGITEYEIHLLADQSKTATLAVNNPTVAEYYMRTVGNLEPATGYQARVRATNEHGQGPWSWERSFTTNNANGTPNLVLSAPETPTRDATTASTVTVSRGFSPSPLRAVAPPATGYDLRYRTGNGNWTVVDMGLSTSYTIRGLESSTTYEVGVRARNDYGDSDWSTSVFARTTDIISITRTGSSTSSQAAARANAEAAARDALPSTATGVTVIVSDLASTTSTTEVTATGTGTGTSSAAAISAAEDDAEIALPSGATNITFTTISESGGVREEYDHTFSVTGVASTRAGARAQALANWRNIADAIPNLVSLGERGVTDVTQTSSERWQAEARGTVVQWRIVDGEREEYENEIVVEASAPTRAEARQQALINWRNVADNVPNFVRLGERGISRVTQLSSEQWDAVVEGTVTLYRTTPHSATVEATGTVTLTTYYARATATGTPPISRPVGTAYSGGHGGGGQGVVIPPTVTPANPSLNVIWTASTGGSTAVTAYDLQYRTGTGSWTIVEDVWETGDGALAYSILGLEPVTEYEIQVRAVRGTSDGTWSASIYATTLATRPSAPAIGTPTATTLPVSWSSAPSDGGSVIIGYDLRYIELDEDETVDANWTEVDVGLVTSYTLTGLTTNTTYEVQVRARGASEDGLWSTSARGTPQTSPGAPGAPSIVPGVRSLALTWTAPTNSYVTAYDVRYIETSADETVDANWTEVDSAWTSGTLSYTITGLADDTEYDVQVRAANDVGNSSWSPTVMGRTLDPPEAPAVPTLAAGTRSLVVTWTAPSAGSSAITAYDVRHIETSADETMDANWTVEVSAWTSGVLSYTITGLANGTEYDVQVRAVSSVGEGAWSATASTRTHGPPLAPAAPSVGEASTTSLDVSWTAPDDGGASITSYDVRYRKGTENWREVNSATTGALTYTIRGLTNATEYEVQVRGVNSFGDGAWSEGGTVSPPTVAPTTPSVTTDRFDLEVSWTAPTDTATITSYDVRYIETSADETVDANWTVVYSVWTSGTLHYTITGLDQAVSYDVQVRSTNGGGESPWSGSGTATTLGVPSQPPPPTVTPDVGSLVVTWTEPDDRGSTISTYDVAWREVGGPYWLGDYGEWSAGDPFSHTIENLEDFTLYEVRVRAYSNLGEGEWSEPTEARTSGTAGTVPGQVTLADVTVGGNSLRVIWTAPNDNGGHAITSYDVRYRLIVDANWTEVNPATSGALSYRLTGLQADRSYLVEVRAVNSLGDGDWSYRGFGIPATADTAPAAPNAPTVSAGSSTSLSVTWTEPADGGSTITAYDVRHIETSADETVDANWTVVDDAWTSGTLTYTIMGLSADTEYDVQVRAVNSIGDGGWSSTGTATTDTATTTNQAPTASATGNPTTVAGGGDVTLDGTANDPDTGDTLTYAWTSDGGGSFADAAVLDTTWTAPDGISTDQFVTLTLTVTDSGGLTDTATVDVTVSADTAPAAPNAPTVSAGSSTSLSVTWTEPADGGSTITAYDVRHIETSADETVDANWTVVDDAWTSGTLTYTIMGLSADTEYDVQVRAVNSIGDGGWSSTGTATTDTATTTNQAPTASATGNPTTVAGGGDVTLDGTANDPDTGDTLTYAWTSDGGGSFADAAVLDTTWTAPDGISTDQFVTLTLTVTDSGGLTDTATVDVTVSADTAPAAPNAPTVSAGSSTSLSVTWTEPADGGSTITAYDVRHIETSADETVDANWTVVDDAWTSGTLTYTIMGLSADTEYDVQVRAVNSIGDGGWSSTGTATTDTATTTNQAPTASATGNPTTVAGGGDVTLDGTANDPDTGDTLTYAWTSDGGGSFADAAVLDTTWTAPDGISTDQFVTLTLTVTDSGGLTDTATVDVTVSADTDDSCVEDLGTITALVSQSGTWSSDCESENGYRTYARYYSFTLAEETRVRLTLTSTDDPAVDTFLFLLEGAGRTGSVITHNDDIGDGSRNSRIVRTLDAGTYTAEATTYLPATEGGFTLEVTPRIAPATPSAPTVSAGSSTSLSVTWTEPADGWPRITAYDVRYIETSADETVDANWTVVDSAWTSSGTLTYTIMGLSADTEYEVQVRAVNSVGDGGWSSSGTATTDTS